DDDLAAITSLLATQVHDRQRVLAEQSAKRWKWVGAIGSAGLAWLTTYTIFKEFLSVTMQSKEFVGIAAVSIGFLPAIVAGVFAWIRSPSHQHHDDGHEGSHLA
ncbi:hypothetical protein RZS08_59105, partial [Arthrospira platensis SPKY1]|nr:hypothetical protein [Arthrospira platensis SPKY1]